METVFSGAPSLLFFLQFKKIRSREKRKKYNFIG
jgi:hypothetical protein